MKARFEIFAIPVLCVFLSLLAKYTSRLSQPISNDQPYTWINQKSPSQLTGFSICGIQPGDSSAWIGANFDGSRIPVYLERLRLAPKTIEGIVVSSGPATLELDGKVLFSINDPYSVACSELARLGLALTKPTPKYGHLTVHLRNQTIYVRAQLFTIATDRIACLELVRDGVKASDVETWIPQEYSSR
jgi:hypothetical protein